MGKKKYDVDYFKFEDTHQRRIRKSLKQDILHLKIVLNTSGLVAIIGVWAALQQMDIMVTVIVMAYILWYTVFSCVIVSIIKETKETIGRTYIEQHGIKEEIKEEIKINIVGKKYKVIGEFRENNIFKIGDIIVALHDSKFPYCIPATEYVEGTELKDYDIRRSDVVAMMIGSEIVEL